jgi:sugar/nucleoside kinase (ribokinase family)
LDPAGGALATTPGSSPGVVEVAGEALIDFVPAGRPWLFEATPGESPANVAVGLARLRVPVRMVARIADDLLGAGCVRTLPTTASHAPILASAC